jgi:hypothetical protein
MDISNYTAFFHDGSLSKIIHQNNKIILCMQSAEIALEELPGNIALSSDDRIKGNLHIVNIENIEINEKKFSDKWKMHFDKGKIFNFEITGTIIELDIIWINYPPHPNKEDFSTIKIKADKIWWKNIPDLKT